MSTPPVDLARLLAEVDADRMVGTVGALAGPVFTGRRAGSPGGRKARRWLGEQLSSLGARVDDVSFEVRAVPQIHAVPKVRRHDGIDLHRLVFGRSVMPHPASADLPAARHGELAVAGSGDPAGRWLAIPAGMSLFDAYGHADGAAGLLIARDTDPDGWHYTVLAGPDPGPLPILMLDPVTHAALIAAAGAGWFTANAPIRRIDVTATNLHANWPASGPPISEVLLTAHYDGVGDHPDLRQPGASDNATGVAVVLEAARILSPGLPHGAGLAVALLDAEELGALGSAHHADRLRAAGASPSVINVDGAGRLGAAAAVEAGGPAHRLLALLDQAGRHTGLPLTAGPVASDNRRYAAAGFAAVGIGAGMGGYHSPADTPERVDPATLVAVCRLVVATVWLTATSTPTLSSLIGD
ncbi:M28 family peptidase [Actinoplanes sichuanensis]|uniref:M28 family metallopeptidase n=1 Tax=Actinoplanes sichuanensis TaxID=512349 RepID=A0ABW4APK6_9ACTN|nr:M28 family peptidase [Actinoplanes sichuanensis]BEL06234.1 M28 family peptidase [Actinoplanes sichuanensis]